MVVLFLVLKHLYVFGVSYKYVHVCAHVTLRHHFSGTIYLIERGSLTGLRPSDYSAGGPVSLRIRLALFAQRCPVRRVVVVVVVVVVFCFFNAKARSLFSSISPSRRVTRRRPRMLCPVFVLFDVVSGHQTQILMHQDMYFNIPSPFF